MAHSKESVRKWLAGYVSRLVGVHESQISHEMTFEEYGLDSTAAAGLSGDLSDWLGVHLEANLTKEYKTIDAVAEYVTALQRGGGRG